MFASNAELTRQWVATCAQVVGVIGTLLIAALAVWGEPIRARIVGPRLALRLNDPQGEKTNFGADMPCRWYHLRVVNSRRSAKASNVRVVLTKIARPGADGIFRPITLSGPVQFQWQNGKYRDQFPSVGPAINADLGHVSATGFALGLMFVPNNIDPMVRAGERLRIELLATSDQVESKPLALEISWNGKWADDAREMQSNMVVKELPAIAATD
jgi:hypothetical protein